MLQFLQIVFENMTTTYIKDPFQDHVQQFECIDKVGPNIYIYIYIYIYTYIERGIERERDRERERERERDLFFS